MKVVFGCVACVLQVVLMTISVQADQKRDFIEVKNAIVDEAKSQVESITVEQLDSIIESGRMVVVVDCRKQAEYDAGHIRTSIWMPRGKLEFEIVDGKLGNLNNIIIVYCKKDSRAALAAATIKRYGYENVWYVQGGFKAWCESGKSIYNLHGELVVKEFEKKE